MTTSSVGLAHDYLLVLRGAERTFAQMVDIWPEAPVYTLLYDDAATLGRFAGHDVRTSALQRLGVRQEGFRRWLPLYPMAVGRMVVEPHDLLLSSSSAFGIGLRPPPGTVHVCYCHSPFRYVWHERRRAIIECPRTLRPIAPAGLNLIRRWDLSAASRVDHFIANSEITRQRMVRFWGRDAPIVHPPVEIGRFSVAPEPEDYLLVVAELVRHKQVSLALGAARRAGRRVKVVGTGPDLPWLRATYGDTAEFLGRVPDSEVAALYARAKAIVVPSDEEFGIVSVEAQAAGRPVVAAGAGGALETVVPGRTGLLFPSGDEGALAEILRDEDFSGFSSHEIVANAARFSTESFQRDLLRAIAGLTGASLSSLGLDLVADRPARAVA